MHQFRMLLIGLVQKDCHLLDVFLLSTNRTRDFTRKRVRFVKEKSGANAPLGSYLTADNLGPCLSLWVV